MILLDVNVVLALFVERHPHHRASLLWLQRQRAVRQPFGVPSVVWHSFVRLATNQVATGAVISLADAFEFLTRLTTTSGYRQIEPGARHLALFQNLCQDVSARNNLVPDAALAAIAIENGATLASFDRDFARFTPQLRWVIPGE